MMTALHLRLHFSFLLLCFQALMRCTESSLACWEMWGSYTRCSTDLNPVHTHLLGSCLPHFLYREWCYYVFPQFSHHVRVGATYSMSHMSEWRPKKRSRLGGHSVLLFSLQTFSPCQRGVSGWQKVSPTVLKASWSHPSATQGGREDGWGSKELKQL